MVMRNKPKTMSEIFEIRLGFLLSGSEAFSGSEISCFLVAGFWVLLASLVGFTGFFLCFFLWVIFTGYRGKFCVINYGINGGRNSMFVKGGFFIALKALFS